MTTHLKEMDSSVDFAELQQLRHFQSKLMVAHSTLEATLNIIREVEINCAKSSSVDEPSSNTSSEGASTSACLRLKCSGYLKSTEVLQLRLQSLAKLVCDQRCDAFRFVH